MFDTQALVLEKFINQNEILEIEVVKTIKSFQSEHIVEFLSTLYDRKIVRESVFTSTLTHIEYLYLVNNKKDTSENQFDSPQMRKKIKSENSSLIDCPICLVTICEVNR